MKTIYESESTPKKDGFYMPGEYEEQERTWILWPHRSRRVALRRQAGAEGLHRDH